MIAFDAAALLNAPLATILVVVGLGFVLLAITGQIGTYLAVKGAPRVMLGTLGIVLVTIGVVIYLAQATDQPQPEGSSQSPSLAMSKVLLADLLAAAPEAKWSAGSRSLTWADTSADSIGFVRWVDNAALENGTSLPRVLETHPEWKPEGTIQGQYLLPRELRAGDVFRAEVGFLDESSGSVQFVVETFGGSDAGVRTVLTHLGVGADRRLTPLNVDLTPSAGDKVIRLVVRAGQDSFEDWAVWVNPRIDQR